MRYLVMILFSFFLATNAFAENRIINLEVAYKTVYFAGKPRQAIAVNNQIPAPLLHFKEGDQVTINVTNKLDKETAIHWHGLIVPWQMDGVLGVSQQGIPPGGVFHYRFTLHQSGSYWYHAHAGLQEQQGLYGALIIDPKKPEPYHYTKDFPIVLSDWINTDPDQVLANLKKEGDYYSPEFPLQPSLMKFIHDYRKASTNEKKQLINDYHEMQKTRMSIYDLSDVAYDAFLLNGRIKSNPWTGKVKAGDIVRLRFIGAGAGTIFRVKIPGSKMEIIHVDGNDVKPYFVDDFTIAPGETYDVLVKIKKKSPYIIYAESSDTTGAAYGVLTPFSKPVDFSQVKPFPEPQPVPRTMMSMMMGNLTMDQSMDHSMPMPTEASILSDKITKSTSYYTTSANTKYAKLISPVKTNNPDKPIAGVINIELFGYMDHYVWFINGLPENKAVPIVLEPGKRYRLVFTNSSMMHHPMHIHGHWFILRKGNRAYDPLLHTIDVPPGAKITVDLDTDASGQWLFHCHLLYHMIAGMARTFQYSTLIELTRDAEKPQYVIKETPYHNRPVVRVDDSKTLDTALVTHPMPHENTLWFANFLDAGISPTSNLQTIRYKGLYGSDENKVELLLDEAKIKDGSIEDANLDVFYWRLVSQFWAIKGGVNYVYRPAETPYWRPGIGIEGLMPYFIDTNLRTYYYHGSEQFDLELSRDTQITNNFFIRTSVNSIFGTKTLSRAEIGSGLNQMEYAIRPYYRINAGLNIFTEFKHERNYGDYKQMQVEEEGGSISENTFVLGFAMTF